MTGVWQAKESSTRYLTNPVERAVYSADLKPVTEKSHLTLGWQMDNFTITHKFHKVIDSIIARLDELFGK